MKLALLIGLLLALPFASFSQTDSLRRDSSATELQRETGQKSTHPGFRRTTEALSYALTNRGMVVTGVGLKITAVGALVGAVTLVGALASATTLRRPGNWVRTALTAGTVIGIGGIATALVGVGIIVYDAVREGQRLRRPSQRRLSIGNLPVTSGQSGGVVLAFTF